MDDPLKSLDDVEVNSESVSLNTLWSIEDLEWRLWQFALLVEQGQITKESLTELTRAQKVEYLLTGPIDKTTAVVALDLPDCLELVHYVLPTALIMFLDELNPLLGQPSTDYWQKHWNELRRNYSLNFEASEKQKYSRDDGVPFEFKQLSTWIDKKIKHELSKKDGWQITNKDNICCNKCGSRSIKEIQLLSCPDESQILCWKSFPKNSIWFSSVYSNRGCALISLLR